MSISATAPLLNVLLAEVTQDVSMRAHTFRESTLCSSLSAVIFIARQGRNRETATRSTEMFYPQARLARGMTTTMACAEERDIDMRWLQVLLGRHADNGLTVSMFRPEVVAVEHVVLVPLRVLEQPALHVSLLATAHTTHKKTEFSLCAHMHVANSSAETVSQVGERIQVRMWGAGKILAPCA
jgi:hypothetical protein